MAITGTEAVANGIPAFRPPESRNAAITIMIMAAILGSLFIGTTYLAHLYRVLPSEGGHETVVSQIARGTFGRGWFYYLIQYATAAILILAANTAFQDFPRLSSILARDRFAPRQLANVGDRLVYSNGIAVLAAIATLLIVVFRGDTRALVPLLVMIFHRIHQHYIRLGSKLRLMEETFVEPGPVKSTSIVLVSSIHRGVMPALEYARSLSHDCRALYIEVEQAESALLRERWPKFAVGDSRVAVPHDSRAAARLPRRGQEGAP